MKSSILQAILWFFLAFCNTVQINSQTKLPKKETAGSVSGKITIKDKGAPRIAVVLRPADFGDRWRARYKGITDQDGNYRIMDVAPGTYHVMPSAPAFVVSGEPRGKTLIITEGETVEGIDFNLTRGGVITGKVTDAEGRPLIEEQILLVLAEAGNQISHDQVSLAYTGAAGIIQTDDRGIYRLFGIPQGKYRVAVGQGEDAAGPRRSKYRQTFYPSVTDLTKATVIEVTEGSEASNVDITAGRSFPTFAVSGRVVHGGTLQPISNMRLGIQSIGNESFTNWGSTSNSQGEFRLENLTPGKYAVLVPSQPNSNLRAAPVTVDVVDQDVTGLLVKTSEGATLSGSIVLEGTNDNSARALLSQARLQTYISNPEHEGPSTWMQPATINADGSFRIAGLANGRAYLSLIGANHRPITGLSLVRVERDALVQLDGIEIKNEEHVTGVRLVVRYGTGKIRGVVRIENGELPANARTVVQIANPGDEPTRGTWSYRPHAEVDSRGRFLVEGLPAGTYELRATVFIPNSRNRPATSIRQVEVADADVTEVTITVNLEPTPNP